MRQIALIVAGCLLIAAPVLGSDQTVVRVQLETRLGNIVLELDGRRAPETTRNFLTYADEGAYDGTIFHRVIKGFMIQGGGLTPDLMRKATHPPVANEADNGLKNLRGTVSMARTGDPHSATSQFFINTKDNAFLNYKAKNAQGWGYCVFGRVVEGMTVVDAIEKQATTVKKGRKDVPVQDVIITRARRIQ